MEETAMKDRRRKNCCVRIKKESRAKICSALCVLSENFFPLRRRLFLVGCEAKKGRGKGRNAERGWVRVGERPEIDGKAVKEMF